MIIEELTRINRKFSTGRHVNKSSLEFAENALKTTEFHSNGYKMSSLIEKAIKELLEEKSKMTVNI